MFQTQYHILKLIEDIGNKIKGRKRLQKLFYIMKHIGFPIFLDYSYYRYGPYSSDLSMVVADLDASGLLAENYSEEEGTYVYEITDKGKDFLQSLEKSKLVEKYDIPKKLIDAAKYIVEQDTLTLELATTIIYLTEYGDSFDNACAKALTLKPRLSGYLDDAKKVIKFIKLLTEG